jgi:hypothetical protein
MLLSLLLLDVIQVNDMEYVLVCFVDLEWQGLRNLIACQH